MFSVSFLKRQKIFNLNPIALRMAKTLWSFGHSEYRVNDFLFALEDIALLNTDLLIKEGICSYRSKFFPLKEEKLLKGVGGGNFNFNDFPFALEDITRLNIDLLLKERICS